VTGHAGVKIQAFYGRPSERPWCRGLRGRENHGEKTFRQQRFHGVWVQKQARDRGNPVQVKKNDP